MAQLDDLTYKTMTELVLSPEHIMAIGLLAAEWGYVESLVELLIWRLAKMPESIGYCITTHIGSVMRIDMLKTLAHETLSDQSIQDEIKSISAEFERLRIMRNDIIHSMWIRKDFFGSGAPVSLRVKAKGRVDMQTKVQNYEDIRKAASDMTALTVRIGSVLQKLPKRSSSLRNP
ncbi:hypothetical protein [Sulfurifustis variabilis]|uniref:hypothetical protein n=1 Tax=Sulfurifustis variabilis TaxID=1675686 RepID=UPI000BBB2FF9|nr:hypothetical protein [Sulfurifustis variabilis]